MVTAIIVADAAVDIACTASSHAAIVATAKLLLEGRAQLRNYCRSSSSLLSSSRSCSSWGCDWPIGGGMATPPVRAALRVETLVGVSLPSFSLEAPPWGSPSHIMHSRDGSLLTLLNVTRVRLSSPT
jgi:hypothetical protein